METLCKNGRRGSVVFSMLCLLAASARAGDVIGPNVLVEPGGIEVPVAVFVLGPEDPGDVDEVREILYEMNRIFQPINVQLSVPRLRTGIMVGDGDRRISAAEQGDVLLGSLFELTGTYLPTDEESTDETGIKRNFGLRKGVALNIVDDVWVEEPQYNYLDWRLLPVANIERAGTPQETARNAVRGVGLTLGVPSSPDPANVMSEGGTGVTIDPLLQGSVFREGFGWIGWERSATAVGLAPELQWAMRHGRNSGANFLSEGAGWIADLIADVYYDHGGDFGYGLGGVDLTHVEVRLGSPLTPIEDRSLTIKAVLYTTDFPLSGGVDVYLGAVDPDDDRKSVDPQDFYSEAELIVGFGKGFAGYVKTGGDGQWNPLDHPDTETTVVGGFSLLKTEIPLSNLLGAMSDDLRAAIANGRPVRFVATASSYSYDGMSFWFEDDATETSAVVKSVPKLLPRIPAESQITSSGTGRPGFWAWGGKAEQPFEVTRDNVHDLKHDFFSGAIPLSEQGTRTSAYANYYDSGDDAGKFDSLNGFANETFPGFDGPATSPGNPADGDDDDHVGVLIITVVDFPAGLNLLGLNIGENMGFFLEVGGTTVTHSFRGLFPRDDDGTSGFVPPDGAGDSELPHHLHAFYVEQAGRYVVCLQVLHTTGGASLEMHDIRPNGDCLPPGDTARGGLFFEEPSQEVVDQIFLPGAFAP